ncbi:MAG TPA: hypothetical protein VJT73_09405 [Polyangiaceae bacterium]|nr:hypothetical protein [Polyangiaceae bacterium]
MRNVRALCGFAVLATAFGCGGSDQSGKGAETPAEPTAAGTPTPEPAPESQMPPAGEPAPGGAQAGQTPGQSGMSQPGQPGMGPSDPGAMGQPGQAQMQLSSQELMMGSVTCVLGPVLYHGPKSETARGGGPQLGSDGSAQPSGAASPGTSATGGGLGPVAEKCMKTAQAVNVTPSAIYNAEPTALDAVRKAVDARLSAEGASTDAADNALGFYDKGIAAAKEARTATDTLVQQANAMTPPARTGSSSSRGGRKAGPPLPSAGAAALGEQLRSHRALGELYQFGRNQGTTEIGTEAQTLAWVIGANRFALVDELPVAMKPYAAEPLFAAILNVPAPTPPAGKPMPTWNDYLAAAARSISATSSTSGTSGRAVGGGPGGAADEKANLKQVVQTTEERLRVLGEQLPPSSELRAISDRTVTTLRNYEATITTTTPTPSQQGQPRKPAPGTPAKPPSSPQQKPAP